eukprot:6905751-Alexandrium_andersonii.AAC.1
MRSSSTRSRAPPTRRAVRLLRTAGARDHPSRGPQGPRHPATADAPCRPEGPLAPTRAAGHPPAGRPTDGRASGPAWR